MKPGDVVVGILEGAVETKVRPAVVISSTTYLVERPDVLVGILTTRPPKPTASTDHALQENDRHLCSHSWSPHGSRATGYAEGMAKVVVDPKKLPDRPVPIPGAKPPVCALPYRDLGQPEEVDEFRKVIREIRHQVPSRPQ